MAPKNSYTADGRRVEGHSFYATVGWSRSNGCYIVRGVSGSSKNNTQLLLGTTSLRLGNNTLSITRIPNDYLTEGDPLWWELRAPTGELLGSSRFVYTSTDGSLSAPSAP
jgi:hypothetical protein